MHLRQQIRNGVAALLTGLTLTDDRVYTSRVRNLDRSRLPAINVMTPEETSEPETMDDPDNAVPLDRRQEMVVELIAAATEDVDDLLDAVAEEVETVLGNNRELGGLAEDCWLQATASTFEGKGESLAGVLSLTYVVEYRTPMNNPKVVG